MLVSVLIPSFERAKLLHYGLLSLISQVCPFEYEIIVLNESGDRETEQVCKHYGVQSVITRPYQQHQVWRVPGFAFNIGAKLSKGDFLFLTCPEIYYIDPVLEIYARALLECPSRRVISNRECSWDDDGRFLASFQPSVLENMRHLDTQLGFATMISRRIFFELGGFDEDFVGIGYDDNDFAERLNAYGCIDFCVNAKIVHLYHSRSEHGTDGCCNAGRYIVNRNLYQSRKGMLVRNAGRSWGQLSVNVIT